MMESSNLNLDLHHHQHDQEFHGSSSAPAPPFHFVNASSTRNHDWNQHDLLLNSGGDDQFMPANNEVQLHSSHDMPMVPDLGIFQWPNTTDQQGYMMSNQSQEQQQQLVSTKSVKEELSESFARLAGVDHLQNYGHLMMMMPSSTSRPAAAAGDLGFVDPVGGFGRGSFGSTAALPTADHQLPMPPPPPPYSNPMGMDANAQALDLLASARFRRTLCAQPTLDDMAYGLGQLQQQPASLCQNKMSPPRFSGSNGNGLEYKSTQSVAKKPRLESRSSFTPFKVRKEKLGDRIAALQQLVAPFGKTDTASVLMEAIGYIKFLQDQVETLSVPYMRSSNNKKMRTSEETSTEEREEPKLDLRSRGLCLVPLSCTSYFTNENEGVWSPPNYRGGT